MSLELQPIAFSLVFFKSQADQMQQEPCPSTGHIQPPCQSTTALLPGVSPLSSPKNSAAFPQRS